MTKYLCIVVAGGPEDYVTWCRNTGRTPLSGTAWAITEDTGSMFQPKTFQVTDRWKEDKRNRRTVRALLAAGVPYGDEDGPWPAERIPDLTWPRRWPFRRAA